MATKPSFLSTLVLLILLHIFLLQAANLGNKLCNIQNELPSTSYFHSTPAQHHKTPQGSTVESPPVQCQSWEQRLDTMVLCTSPETSSPEIQPDLPGSLPGFFPTPGKEVHHLTTQLQRNWPHLFECQKKSRKDCE